MGWAVVVSCLTNNPQYQNENGYCFARMAKGDFKGNILAADDVQVIFHNARDYLIELMNIVNDIIMHRDDLLCLEK